MSAVPRNPLPRWRGFNLLEMFHAPAESGALPPPFRQTDFQWLAGWGFDFVRLPMSYRCWSTPETWFRMDERVLGQIDTAVDWGRVYGIHVCLNLHRAPGYCVNRPPEPRNLWRDPEALAACVHHWRSFARRYRGIPSDRLSFDLLNEPLAPGAEMTRTEHEHVIRTLVAAIRAEDPQRLIIADGLSWGNDPIPELADLGIAQSCRAYLPMGISHYRAHWVKSEVFPEPRWPGGDHWGETWDRARLEAHYAQWAALLAQGIGVHCGEGGCFNLTPQPAFLAWFRDVLEILTALGIGYALWNLRGSFGILDSERPDVAYTDWHGHRLDAQLLDLLRRH